MQDIQFKSNPGQFNIDEAQGIVECFVAGIGNKDSVGDIVITGAFAKSLIRRKPRVVWGHNWNDPIGKVLEIYEVPPNDSRLPEKMKTAGIGGLYAKVQFNLNSEKGREAFANVAFFGEEQEWSIGYKTLDAIYDNSRQANVLREVELYELSPVLHGANQLTGTISVKSDEKVHEMSPMGMIVLDEKPKQPADPFLQGVAQPLSGDRLIALENELSARTGGPVKIMKATESSVTFMKPGKGLFRLGYYFDGEQYMFGKPEKLGMPVMIRKPMMGMPKPMMGMPTGGRPTMGPKPTSRIPNFPGVMQKPYTSEGPIIPVKYGDSGIQSGLFDSLKSEESLESIYQNKIKAKEQEEIAFKLLEITSSLQEIIDGDLNTSDAWVIPCAPENAFEIKQTLDPVFDYHRIESYVTDGGIVLVSPMDYEAFEAVENATKSLMGRLGRGLIPGGGGKVRRGRTALAKITGVLDPRKRRDLDGDGMIFDGTWREMPDPTRVTKPSGGAITQRVFGGLRSESKPPDGFRPDPEDVKPTVAPPDKKTPKSAKFAAPWYVRAAQKGRKIVPFIIPRKTKPKIERMIDDFLEGDGSSLPEDHVLRRVGKAIKTSKRYTELVPEVNEFGAETGFTRPKTTQDFLPDIDEEMLEELRKAWPDIKDGLSKTGQHRRTEAGQIEKGRTPFEILNEVIEKGQFSRVNKMTPNLLTPEQGRARDREIDKDGSTLLRVSRFGRVRGKLTEAEKLKRRRQRGVDTRAGQVRLDRGGRRQTKWPKGIPHPPFNITTTWAGRGDTRKFTLSYEKIIDGKKVDLLAPYIKEGIFPENWREMDIEEKFKWFNDNSETLSKINGGMQWKNTLNKLKDILFEDIMRSDEEKERQAARAARAARTVTEKPKTPEAPKIPEAPKTPKAPETSTTERTSTPSRARDKTRRNIEAWAETIGESISRYGDVDDDFGNSAMDTAARVLGAAYPDDGAETTAKNFQDALDSLDEGITELAKIGDERRLSKREKALLQFMYQIREDLENRAERSDDIEAEMGTLDSPDGDDIGLSADAARELARRGEIAERFGLDDDDDDVESGADLGEIYFGTERQSIDPLSSESNMRLRSSTARARAFQASNRRKKQGRGLSSSTTKDPRTQITKESTWWQKINDSLRKEITSADSNEVRNGLTLLQEKIRKYEAAAFKPDSKRTNVGSIKITADEADKILDAVMAVIDRQKSAGKGGSVGSRGEIFAELLEAIASAAMSTFVDKSSPPADE